MNNNKHKGHKNTERHRDILKRVSGFLCIMFIFSYTLCGDVVQSSSLKEKVLSDNESNQIVNPDVSFLIPFSRLGNREFYTLNSYIMWSFLGTYVSSLVHVHDMPHPIMYSTPYHMRILVQGFKIRKQSPELKHFEEWGNKLKCKYIVSQEFTGEGFDKEFVVTVKIYATVEKKFIYEHTMEFSSSDLPPYHPYIKAYIFLGKIAVPLAEKIVSLYNPRKQFLSPHEFPSQEELVQINTRFENTFKQCDYQGLIAFYNEMIDNIKRFPCYSAYWAYLSMTNTHLALMLEHKTQLYNQYVTNALATAFIALHFDTNDYAAQKALAVVLWGMGDVPDLRQACETLKKAKPADSSLLFYPASLSLDITSLSDMKDAFSNDNIMYTTTLLNNYYNYSYPERGIDYLKGLSSEIREHPLVKSIAGRLMWCNSEFQYAVALFTSAMRDISLQGLEVILPILKDHKCITDSEEKEIKDCLIGAQEEGSCDWDTVVRTFAKASNNLKTALQMKYVNDTVSRAPLFMTDYIVPCFFENVLVNQYINYADTYRRLYGARERGEQILRDLEQLFPDNIIVVDNLASFYYYSIWDNEHGMKYENKLFDQNQYYLSYLFRNADKATLTTLNPSKRKLAKIIRMEPFDYDWLMKAFDKCYELEDWDKAQQSSDQAHWLYPEALAPQLQMMEIKMKRDGQRLTIEELDEILSLLNGKADRWLAELYNQNGYREKAVILYKQYVKDNPRYWPYYAIAKYYQQIGDYDTYLKTVEEYISRVPPTLATARAYHDIFLYYFSRGNFATAKKYLDLGYEGQCDAMQYSAYYSFAVGDRDAAKNQLEACSRRYRSVEAKDDLRWLYMRMNMWDEMLKKGDQLIETNYGEESGYLFKSTYYAHKQDFETAEKVLQEFIAAPYMEQGYQPYYFLAEFYLERGMLDKALEYNSMAMERKFGDEESLYFQKIDILLRKNTLEEAKKVIDYCVVNYRLYYKLNDLLTRYYLQIGDIEKAEKARLLNKTTHGALWDYAATHARVLLAKGKKNEALDYMRLNDKITLQMRPYRIFYLGEVLRMNGFEDEARKAYKRVIDQVGPDGYYGKKAVEIMGTDEDVKNVDQSKSVIRKISYRKPPQ